MKWESKTRRIFFVQKTGKKRNLQTLRQENQENNWKNWLQLQSFTISLFLLFLLQFSEAVFAETDSPAPVQQASRSLWKLAKKGVGSGSGFFLSPRIIATNFHVAFAFMKDGDLSGITLSQNGEEPEGLKIKRIFALSPLEDIALLEVDREVPFYFTLREESFPQDGELFVLGYPAGTFRVMKKSGSLKRFQGYSMFPVNYVDTRGASGGPVVDSKGRLAGMLTKGHGNFVHPVSVAELKGVFSGEVGTHCKGIDSGKCLKEAARRAIEKGRKGTPKDRDALGMMYGKGYGVDQNFEQAVFWYEQAALKIYAPAQANLGNMYETGHGVERNFKQAVFWYEQAALQGFVQAQNNLGNMYETGRGVVRNLEQAVFWYNEAALQGDAISQNNLGNMYETGRGVVRNLEQAVFWYKKAALQGRYVKAQKKLGYMYRMGRGVDRNFERVVFWYEQAALQGDVQAQNRLGNMYEKGRGVVRNLEQAVFWYEQAALQGYAPAQKRLNRLHRIEPGVERPDCERGFGG